ncbi:cell wall assembly and cell proliferation coordinating protein [Aspergillus candidus]|uniref:Cell wall assembly and cell proliferation coordinating protein n=1 Tax=Aspergillus candidus TaxID=41067 RepID=A0A2I2F250_ASPCN|nr:cell wall assembly and cell proliferation coordinating protein [Aspergillus candidus]PLB34715.1 cell wall assembly and cell proliferation coordinating protein [Aspergillus candidus]
MANPIGGAWRSFWHAMTSYDRHASHDSPYRTGRHVPLSQSRDEPLTSIATSAIESRPDLTDPYEENQPKDPTNSTSNGWSGSPTAIGSPNRPYSPGMRSVSSQKRRSTDPGTDGAGEIQMQSFHDGAPPPPPVAHSWRKIERWLESNYEELFDNLCEGCTQNDINELEHDLDCSLPLELRESLMVHDGQERPGVPTGVIFGCMLLDCEEMVQEWKNWRIVNEEYFGSSEISNPPLPKAVAGSSSSAVPTTQGSNPLWRQDLLERQESQPPGAIQKAYAHPAWIPVARDWGGNHIAIDLAPGPAGKWGQVIIFGRDYDCKYVVARSWAAFLAVFADDLCSGKVHVDEDTNELKLLEFKAQNVEPPYLEILRWRTDQKYGRRPPRRKAPNGLGLSTAGKSGKDSPYGSPGPSEERGRSPHRFPNRGSTQSPKTQFGISSPLARVTEEAPSPVNPTPDTELPAGPSQEKPKEPQGEDLMEVTTPDPSSGKENEGVPEKGSEQKPTETEKGQKRDSNPGSTTATSDTEVLGEMKNVAI